MARLGIGAVLVLILGGSTAAWALQAPRRPSSPGARPVPWRVVLPQYGIPPRFGTIPGQVIPRAVDPAAIDPGIVWDRDHRIDPGILAWRDPRIDPGIFGRRVAPWTSPRDPYERDYSSWPRQPWGGFVPYEFPR